MRPLSFHVTSTSSSKSCAARESARVATPVEKYSSKSCAIYWSARVATSFRRVPLTLPASEGPTYTNGGWVRKGETATPAIRREHLGVKQK